MIRAWLHQHWHALILTIKRLLSAPVTNLLSILVMGIAISLPVGVLTLMENLHTISGQISISPQISLFLKQHATQDDIDHIRTKLEENKLVARYQFVSKDQALYQLQLDNGLSEAVHNLVHNPLPDAFVVDIQDVSADVIDQLRADMQTWSAIEHAQFDSAWAKRLEALMNFSRMLVFVLLTLLSIAIVAVMFNTIRLQILTRQTEIEVSKLIGATDAFIRRPFLYFGALQGFAGGITAWLIITFVLQILNDELQAIAGLYAMDLQLHTTGYGDTLSLLLFTTWLGWLGARASVASHLWQIEPR